ncbi:MAG: serine/threonine protein kinase [Chloroflexi bacterium]|nr:serine/threonine protein kinase [Chloroflexota bacterium]
MMDELIGKRLGQYQVEAILGKGAMATVFKAYQASLDRYVAIKVLPPSFASQNPAFIKRFQREAKSIARLYHPNILPVYDFGIDRDYSYIVMRQVAGAQSLSQVIANSAGSEQIIDIISQIASALAYAHAQGVIHRDVKPSNVLFDSGWALLSDFGLVKVHEMATQITDLGKGIGTPAYMSPEQAQGGPIDHRTDIYSLGAILYEMLTGRIPHEAPTALGILLKRTTQPPISPRAINPTISKSLEQVTLRSLAIHPADRYDSAEDFIAALKIAAADESYQEPGLGTLERKTLAFTLPTLVRFAPQKDSLKAKLPKFLRNPIWLTVGGIGVAAVVLSLWSGSAYRSEASQPTPTFALAPTSTNMASPTLTSTPIPTNTPVLTATPTITPLPPTLTATNTASSTTPSSLPVVVPSPTARASPTSNIPSGEFTLLKPVSLEEPSYGPTEFEWQWTGQELPPEFGFEVRVWREGEPPAGAHNAVLDNQQGHIERIGENKYRLNIDIQDAYSVRRRTGQYFWTVALVRISPNYADLGQQAEPSYLRFEAGGKNYKDNGGVVVE